MRTQIATMNGVMEKFPTAQDALNYGCYRATVYVAGIAAHYVCLKNITATPDAEKPLMLLYGGSEPTAPIVGLSYMMVVGGSPNKQANAPLWAQYMPWHFHEGLCTDKAGLVIGGDHTTKADCEARGGKVGGRTGWMGHYWPKSCPSPDGAFSADNPRLDWNVGSYNDDPKRAKQTAKLLRAPCAGSKMTIDAAGSDSYAKPSGMSNRAQIDTAATPSGRDMQHSSAAHDTPTSKP